MKLQKYMQYLILEGSTPEDYMKQALLRIKAKIDPIFNEEEVKKLKDFQNFNLNLLNTPAVDNYARNSKSLKYKFTDETGIMYELTFEINLTDAINPEPDQDYRVEDIKKIHVTFKKYDNNSDTLELINQLLDRTVDPDKIDPDYLIELKLEIDGDKIPEEEEFQIETEDENSDVQDEDTPKDMPEEESNENS